MNSTVSTPLLPTSCSAAPRELLTQAQLAGRLGISRRTVSTWVRNKTVPMIKVRGFCRFEFPKVLAALEQHEQAAASTTPEHTQDIAR